MADDIDLVFDGVAFAEAFDLFRDVPREMGDGIGIEGGKNSAQIEAEDAETVAVQAVFESLENSPRGSITVDQQDGVLQRSEVAASLHGIALDRALDIGERTSGMALYPP